MEIFIYI